MFSLMMAIANDESINYDQTELEKLLLSIGDGDKDALGVLYGIIKDSVYGYSLSILKNSDDAEDVLHDCVISIWNNAKSYRVIGKPMAWILTITRNLCLMKIRKMSRQEIVHDENWEQYLESKDEISHEDKIVISACIGDLQEEEREILLLHILGGLKHREIAELLNKPVSTILSKYKRTLEKIRQLLIMGEVYYEA